MTEKGNGAGAAVGRVSIAAIDAAAERGKWSTAAELAFLRRLGHHGGVGLARRHRPETTRERRVRLLENYVGALEGEPPRRWDDGVDPAAVRVDARYLLLRERELLKRERGKGPG